MQRVFWIACSGLLILASSASSVCSQEKTGWNPFRKDSEVRSSSFFNGGEKNSSSLLGLPKISPLEWLPFRKEVDNSENPVVPASATERVDSKSSKLFSMDAIKKPMSSAMAKSKRAWRSTVDWVNPFDQAPEVTPTKQGYRPQDETKPKKSFWTYLLPYDPEPEPEEINNVIDFLGRDSPRLP